MPQNYRMLAENQNKIPNLSIYNLALGSECGTLNFAFGGENSGASRKSDNGEIEVNVSTVDHFVKENKIEKVDFIKADIEGAECDMLQGAAETIRRFHPKLAICIYHRGQTDHYNVPETILSIRKDYEFYVEAYKDTLAETVLFAQPVNYTPERNMYPTEMVSIVKEMYQAVYDRLWNGYKKLFQYEFRRQMNQYLKCDFEWQMNVNHGKLFLTDNRKVHYKIIFTHNGLDILLVFDGYEQYHDVHKKKIKHILDSFLETHIAYKMIVTKGSTYITKRLPVAVTPDSVACNMAELMKGTFIGLWQAGIVSPECAKPVLDTLEWKGSF